MKSLLCFFSFIRIIIANESLSQNAPNIQNSIVHWPQNILASFGISPNPATNRVTLSFNYKGLGKYMDVIDLNGTIVKSASTNEDVFNIDLNGLASGHYLIRVHYSDFSMPTEFEKLIILE